MNDNKEFNINTINWENISIQLNEFYLNLNTKFTANNNIGITPKDCLLRFMSMSLDKNTSKSLKDIPTTTTNNNNGNK
jgi:hypothetical protein